jgi:hypothetical protein
MTTIEVGKKLVALVREGKSTEAIQTLYDPKIISVEAGLAASGPQQSTGIPACLERGKMWREANEVHSATVEGPFPNGDRFAVFLGYEVTPRATGKRGKIEEIGVYTVRDGKITREEFFYSM